MSLNMVSVRSVAVMALAFFPCSIALEAAMQQAQMKQVSLAKTLPSGPGQLQQSLLPACLTWSSISTDSVFVGNELEQNLTDLAATASSSQIFDAEEEAEATPTTSVPLLAKPINFATLLVVLDMIRRCFAGVEDDEDDEEEAVDDAPAEHTQSGWETFAKAIALNDVDKCQALLNAGMKVTEKDLCGNTLLHLAAGEGFATLVSLLLEHGAEVDALDASAETPLHAAARSGSATSCELLLDKGATIDSANMVEQTPLLIAAHADEGDSCALLLRRGAGGEAAALLGSSVVGLAKESSKKAEFDCRVAEAHFFEAIGDMPADDDAPKANIDSLKDLISRLQKCD